MYNPSDLLTKEFRAARGRMADPMCIDLQCFQLRCCNIAERDDFVAWKKIEKIFEHR